jgi:hypothetical protein
MAKYENHICQVRTVQGIPRLCAREHNKGIQAKQKAVKIVSEFSGHMQQNEDKYIK